MHKKMNAYLLALVIGVAAFVLSGRQSEQVAFAAPVSSYDLLSALPSSDFIIYVDGQRISTDIIPAILVDQPEARAKVESNLDLFTKETGFDPRLIDAVAVGFNFSSQKASDAAFTVIVRGSFDANTVIETGLVAAAKKSRGEMERRTRQYEGRTIYMLARTAGVATPPSITPDTDNEPSRYTMTFVALDSNTVVFGSMKSVQATIDASLGRGRVDDELVQLATRTPNAAVCFGGNVTPDMASAFRLHNTRIDDSVSSIKQVYGSFSTSGNDADTLINLRMDAAEDARQLSSALNGLKYMARLISDKDSVEKKSIEAIVKGLDIYQVGNEVQIVSKLALKDLSPFIPLH